jgi:hypothetical protein
MTFHDSAGLSPGNRQDKSSWRREGDLKISASLETLKFQGRSDVPLPVYPEVYPKPLTGIRSPQYDVRKKFALHVFEPIERIL